MKEEWISPGYEEGLVSVIIPCYNQERYLSACLESISKQEYRPIEIIIVDDGSADRTSQIMKNFQGIQMTGIVVKCLFQSRQGAQHARNQGLRHAKGEYIQFLDSDDLLCCEKLTEQVMVFQNNSETDIVYGDGQYLIDFHEANAIKGKVISIGPSSDMIESLLSGNWVPLYSYLSRRSAVQRCGPWDNKLEVLQDFEYFLRMALQGCRFHYRPGITGYYRKHSFSSISEQSSIIRGRTRQRILAQAEHFLITQDQFNKQRVQALVENHRRIARSIYLTDIDFFNSSLDDILRLCPNYRPVKLRAHILSSIFGFRNYEKFAAMISHMILKIKRTGYDL
jgi:glycosyltransferase involved in cell wall biosynthesis